MIVEISCQVWPLQIQDPGSRSGFNTPTFAVQKYTKTTASKDRYEKTANQAIVCECVTTSLVQDAYLQYNLYRQPIQNNFVFAELSPMKTKLVQTGQEQASMTFSPSFHITNIRMYFIHQPNYLQSTNTTCIKYIHTRKQRFCQSKCQLYSLIGRERLYIKDRVEGSLEEQPP